MLINESEAIDNCIKSLNIISKETAISKHPWVEDLEKELNNVALQKPVGRVCTLFFRTVGYG